MADQNEKCIWTRWPVALMSEVYFEIADYDFELKFATTYLENS